MLNAISVVIVTKNEARRLEKCLRALSDFNHIVVVDSASADGTQDVARRFGVEVVEFVWDGRYPKKRQWCLDHLNLRDWVLFIDADEIMTPELAAEIAALDLKAAGYFIKGRYVYDGRLLRFGLANNKLALINRHRMHFPVIDDLDVPGMGEIEGHYQPVLKYFPGADRGRVDTVHDISQIPAYAGKAKNFGQLKSALIHEAYDENWSARHERYAAWEQEMNARNAWPADARLMKRVFRRLPLKPLFAFGHCYVLKRGFLDGRAGFGFARSRARYYAMISKPSKVQGQSV